MARLMGWRAGAMAEPGDPSRPLVTAPGHKRPSRFPQPDVR
jgi:hypothetical protein